LGADVKLYYDICNGKLSKSEKEKQKIALVQDAYNNEFDKIRVEAEYAGIQSPENLALIAQAMNSLINFIKVNQYLDISDNLKEKINSYADKVVIREGERVKPRDVEEEKDYLRGDLIEVAKDKKVEERFDGIRDQDIFEVALYALGVEKSEYDKREDKLDFIKVNYKKSLKQIQQIKDLDRREEAKQAITTVKSFLLDGSEFSPEIIKIA